MMFILEGKKARRTGWFPAALAGCALAAAFPILNMAFRAEAYRSLPGTALEILLAANWQVMALLHVLLVVMGACLLYHTEFASNAIQKMRTLPLQEWRLFLGKWALLLAVTAGALCVEYLGLAFCAWHWFGECALLSEEWGKNVLFALGMTLPALSLSLVIASACRKLWISLGAGVILVFAATMFIPLDGAAALFPFALPFRVLAGKDGETARTYEMAAALETLLSLAAEGIVLRARNASHARKRSRPAVPAGETPQERSGVLPAHLPVSARPAGHFLTFVRMEGKKLRHSKILLLLGFSAVFLWLPSLMNLELALEAKSAGLSPEDNYRIQGFLAMTWFLYPACMAVCTVLLTQVERSHHGLVKMLTLPLRPAKWCAAKFVVLLFLAALQVLASTAAYFCSATVATLVKGYSFLTPPLLALKEGAMVYLTSIPMLAFFWMIAVAVRTPAFSMGISLAAIVPSVFAINTRLWHIYPPCYPLYWANWERTHLAGDWNAPFPLLPWLPIALGITVLCLWVSCARYGAAQRK